jgi:hypothetical protein
MKFERPSHQRVETLRYLELPRPGPLKNRSARGTPQTKTLRFFRPQTAGLGDCTLIAVLAQSCKSSCEVNHVRPASPKAFQRPAGLHRADLYSKGSFFHVLKMAA